MPLGFVTIFVEILLFVIGAINWLVAIYTTKTPSFADRVASLVCPIVLLANFPVAFFIVATVIAIQTAYHVEVVNNSPAALVDVHVVGPGINLSLGTILPGNTSRGMCHANGDGELRLTASSGSVITDQEINSYVTTNMGGHITIAVGTDGVIQIGQNRHHD